MKSFGLGIVVLLLSGASSAKCLDLYGRNIAGNTKAVIERIEQEWFCEKAVETAKNCAVGDQLEIDIVKAALNYCRNALVKQQPSEEELNELVKEEKECFRKKRKESISSLRIAYCQLDATAEAVEDISEKRSLDAFFDKLFPTRKK